MPGVLKGVDLGDHPLEIGPGPGLSTDWLRTRVPQITAIEIDPRLAAQLRERLAGSNVTVVEGDASAMPFPDEQFSSVLSFTMLHHVPYALQDRLLAEAARVLRPGGTLAGMDSTPSFTWNVYHLFDDRNPVDPSRLPARLESAGFRDVSVRSAGTGFSFRAMR